MLRGTLKHNKTKQNKKTTPCSLWGFSDQGWNLGPSMEVPSPNHWIVREFPRGAIFLMLRISSSGITEGFIALNLES